MPAAPAPTVHTLMPLLHSFRSSLQRWLRFDLAPVGQGSFWKPFPPPYGAFSDGFCAPDQKALGAGAGPGPMV